MGATMRWLSELGRRLRMLLWREQFERDLQDEVRLHLDLREQEQIDSSLSPEDAHSAARRKFGNTTLLREVSGDAWGWNWLDQFAQDLRYGARAMVRGPAFTAGAGTGATRAVPSRRWARRNTGART